MSIKFINVTIINRSPLDNTVANDHHCLSTLLKLSRNDPESNNRSNFKILTDSQGQRSLLNST